MCKSKWMGKKTIESWQQKNGASNMGVQQNK